MPIYFMGIGGNGILYVVGTVDTGVPRLDVVTDGHMVGQREAETRAA
jgi:hypothetical protein